MFGYIWRSVSTAGGTHCSWEWTSNFFSLAADNYLSWDSNPSGEGRVVSKRDALTTRPRRPLRIHTPQIIWMSDIRMIELVFIHFKKESSSIIFWLRHKWSSISYVSIKGVTSSVCVLHGFTRNHSKLTFTNKTSECAGHANLKIRHKTQVHHPVASYWHRVNQSWNNPLDFERLGRLQYHFNAFNRSRDRTTGPPKHTVLDTCTVFTENTNHCLYTIRTVRSYHSKTRPAGSLNGFAFVIVSSSYLTETYIGWNTTKY